VTVLGYRLHVRAAFPLDYAGHAGGFTRAVATSPFVLCETLRAQRLPVPAFTLALRSGKTQTYNSAILYYRTAAERDESIGKSIAIAGEDGVRRVVIQKLNGTPPSHTLPAAVRLFLMPGSRRRCRPRERVIRESGYPRHRPAPQAPVLREPPPAGHRYRPSLCQPTQLRATRVPSTVGGRIACALLWLRPLRHTVNCSWKNSLGSK
jgi:hypothetical protein